MSSFIKDFKAFIMKGNVIDLAVAVIIGGAFKPVISSMVDDIIMPPIGMALGGVDFSKLQYVIQQATIDGQAEVAIRYGMFIQKVVDFLIIGFCVFLIIKAYAGLTSMRKKDEAPADQAPPEPPAEEKLLSEIRDILKQKASV